ncbi:MAG: PIN domain-containing protein [Candidatus Eiseniibacteriota bacterium]
MIAYIDSSVLLRVLLGQEGRLGEWKKIETGVASALVEVECLRTLDRLRLAARVPESEIAVRREGVFRLLEAMEVVEPSWPILRRASQPLPAALGTLDAIHLATAMSWQESRGAALVMATHDAALALAARASGLRVVGV